MNCREAKTELALLVGNDLPDPADREALKRHVSTCPTCRAQYRQLKQAFSVLEQSEKECTYETRDSLWPAVSARLTKRRSEPQLNLRKWWPLGSFLAACLLVAFFLQPIQQHPENRPIDRGLFPSVTPLVPHDHEKPTLPAPDEPKKPLFLKP